MTCGKAVEKNYEVSRYVRKKLKEIEEFVYTPIGEWENTEEEDLIEAIGNICLIFEGLIDTLHMKTSPTKKEVSK